MVAEEYFTAEELAESAEIFGTISDEIPEQNGRADDGLTWLSDYQLKEAQYIDRPLLQAATFHLLGGRPGVGKGAICSWWVAQCTRGEMYGEPRRVLWLSSEDDPEIDLGPRVEAAGGNRKLVGLIPHTFQLPHSIEWLHKTLSHYSEVGLVLIDPLSNHTGKAKTNNEEEVRGALMPLGILAGELDVPILGVRHITTKEAKGGALSHILGSTAWIGVPRVVLAAVKDPTSPEIVHVRPIKGNRVPVGEAGRQYVLEGRVLPGFKESVVVASDDGVSDADIDTLLAGEAETASQKAEAVIIEVLRQNDGVVSSKTLDYAVAEKTGLKVSTLRKVRSKMKDAGAIEHQVSERDEHGKAQKWTVHLTEPLLAPNEAPGYIPARARARAGEHPEKSLLSFAGVLSDEQQRTAKEDTSSGDLQGLSKTAPHEQASATTTHAEGVFPREESDWMAGL